MVYLKSTFFWWTSLVAQMVNRLPTMQETRVQSLGRGDPLEKEMATHSSILAWRIPRTEEPRGLQSMGVSKTQTWWKRLSMQVKRILTAEE